MTLIPNINNQSIAILSDIEQWKEDIADAINTKGGNSTSDESFQQLADDIRNLDDTFITYGITTNGEKIDWLMYICDINTIVRNFVKKIKNNIITNITNSYSFKNCIGLESVDFNAVTTISGSYTFQNCQNLTSVNFPELTTISGSYTFQNCQNLTSVNFPKLTSTGDYTFQDCNQLKIIELPSALILSNYSLMDCTNLTEIIAPNVYSIARSAYYRDDRIKNIVVGTLTSYINQNYNQYYLENMTIGYGTDINLSLEYWKATYVINRGQSGINELNSNLYNNLLTKLYDHSNDGETRTLRLGWLAYVTPENITYANAKGWTLTT